MKITKRVVDGLKPGAFVWDRGFGCKATETGTKVYVVSYRIGRRKRRYTIGTHGHPWTPDVARKEAARLLTLVGAGLDPMATKMAARTAPTVRDLAERFLREHVEAKKKPKTQEEYRRLVDKNILPVLGSRAITAVTAADVGALHHRFRRTPTTANRAIAVLSKAMTLAERWGLRLGGTNPCRGLERYNETKRRRYLSPDELARIGRALADAERDGTLSIFAIAAIKLIVLTGARRHEILSLRWEHVDLDAGELRLPDSKTGAKTLYLAPAAIEVLRALPHVAGNPHVIVGRRAGAHLVNLKDPWQTIRAAAKVDGVMIHDLRRTHASIGINAGLALATVGGLLGHATPTTTARYAFLSGGTLKGAAELVGQRIATAMGNGR
jgi:integrase